MDRVRAERFLLDHGAAEIEHPGGTLFAHLCRVADQLDGNLIEIASYPAAPTAAQRI